MRFGYPIMLDLTDRPVVIVGGGGVAVRKAKGVLDAGAPSVTVISPEFHPEMPAGVTRIEARYAPDHLDGAGLVFAVTNVRAVNDAVVADCNSRGILVNRADTDETLPGDFATPAQLRRGPVTVTVSAGSAALAAKIRDGLASGWNDNWTRAADAMRTLRPTIVGDSSLPPDRRAEMLRALASDEAIGVAAAAGVGGLSRWLAERFGLPLSEGDGVTR